MIDRKIFQQEEHIWINIATLTIEVVSPAMFDLVHLLPSLQPFKCDTTGGDDVICSIRIVEQPIDIEPDSANVLYEVYGILGYWFCLMETEQHYFFDVQYVANGNRYRMVSDKIFSTAMAYIDMDDNYADRLLSLFLMIVFAHSAVLHKTLMIHASVIEKDQKGYVFLGKSGMGKSTHSALWLQYVEDTSLFNDDNPAIRIEEDGCVNVYGTPWSGKTPCYKNRKAQLQAMVRIQQAPENRFTWKKGVDALTSLLPSCLSMRWNSLLYTQMCNLLEEIIEKVNIGYLECLPDKEAALLCYKETNKEIINHKNV